MLHHERKKNEFWEVIKLISVFHAAELLLHELNVSLLLLNLSYLGPQTRRVKWFILYHISPKISLRAFTMISRLLLLFSFQKKQVNFKENSSDLLSVFV